MAQRWYLITCAALAMLQVLRSVVKRLYSNTCAALAALVLLPSVVTQHFRSHALAGPAVVRREDARAEPTETHEREVDSQAPVASATRGVSAGGGFAAVSAGVRRDSVPLLWWHDEWPWAAAINDLARRRLFTAAQLGSQGGG